jgi:hypothetical protein
MKEFKSLIQEVKTGRTVVMAFGRLNPPTSGHGLLVDKVVSEAKKRNGKHVIYLSATQDAKKNPLNVTQKVHWAKKSFPGANIVGATDKVRTFIEAIKELDGTADTLVMVAGSDRVPEYKQLLNKYNGRDFNFQTIEVVSAGERDPDSDGAAGMSATKMRQAAADNNFNTFKSGLSKHLTDADARKLMQEIRTGLGIKNVAETVFEVSKLRNAFYHGEILKVGEIVAEGDSKYEILERGSNYVTVCNESGQLSKKFIDKLRVVEEPMNYAEGSLFKGFVPGEAFLESIITPFKQTVEKYENGFITDAVAILRSLHCVSEALTTEKPDLSKAVDSLGKIGELDEHAEYLVDHFRIQESMETPIVKPSDKMKVAKIIADAFGVDSSSSSPEMLVNSALRSLKGKPLRPDLLAILKNMLGLAAEVKIKYDASLVPAALKEGLDEIAQSTLKSYTFKAMRDTIQGKKDRNKGMKRAYSKLAGTDKPLMKEGLADETEYHVEMDAIGYEQLRQQLKKHNTLDDKDVENGAHPDKNKPGHSLHTGNETVRKMKARKLMGHS